ncbi:hypothetical protein A7311_06115 [Paenibacillus polymyxa]|nr:hypothetical protein A7311_06115 [Paenibacillus polymyxa]
MDDTTIIVSSMLHFDFMIENEQEVTVLGCVLLGWLLWSTKGTKDSFTNCKIRRILVILIKKDRFPCLGSVAVL